MSPVPGSSSGPRISCAPDEERLLCELSEAEWLAIGADRDVPLRPVRPDPFEALSSAERTAAMSEAIVGLVERGVLRPVGPDAGPVQEAPLQRAPVQGAPVQGAPVRVNGAADQREPERGGAFDTSTELEVVIRARREPERVVIVEGMALGLVSSTQYYGATKDTGGFVVESSAGGTRRFALAGISRAADRIVDVLLPSQVEDPGTTSPVWVTVGERSDDMAAILEVFRGAERVARVVCPAQGPQGARWADFTVISRGSQVSVLRSIGLGAGTTGTTGTTGTPGTPGTPGTTGTPGTPGTTSTPAEVSLALARMGAGQVRSVVDGVLRG